MRRRDRGRSQQDNCCLVSEPDKVFPETFNDVSAGTGLLTNFVNSGMLLGPSPVSETFSLMMLCRRTEENR